MSFIIQEELMLFLHTLMAGAGLLAVYDVLRILRKVVPHPGLAVAAEDILYWIFNALFIFYMLYRENSGAVRGYVIAGIVIGMLSYNLTLSPYLVKWISGVLNAVLGVIRRALAVILRPFRFARRCAVRKIGRLLRKLYAVSGIPGLRRRMRRRRERVRAEILCRRKEHPIGDSLPEGEERAAGRSRTEEGEPLRGSVRHFRAGSEQRRENKS